MGGNESITTTRSSLPRPHAPASQIDEHKLSLQLVCERLGVTVEPDNPARSAGLTDSIAAQRLQQNGPNLLKPPVTKAPWRLFLDCLLSLFNILLLIAATISIILFITNGTSEASGGKERDWPDLIVGCVILAITLLNTTIEFVEQRKSQAIVSSFMSLVPSKCSVIRQGQLKSVVASELVDGDVVLVRTGDKVPADILLFHCAGELKLDNSSLTGESEPQERIATNANENILEATNIAFNSSLVVSGEGYGIVIRTGDDTMIGQIAGLTLNEQKRSSPLTEEIAAFVKLITGVAVTSAVILIIVIQVKNSQADMLSTLNFAIGVLLAWVPQGLPLTVTMLLKTASTRMLQQNVVVKNLTAVETLGAITLLATDKTGTLTRNQMTVATIWTQFATFASGTAALKQSTGNFAVGAAVAPTQPIAGAVTGSGGGVGGGDTSVTLQMISGGGNALAPLDISIKGISEIAHISAMCSRAKFDSLDVPLADRQIFGDATETGLFRMAVQLLGPRFDALGSEFPKVFEIPFNSDTKWHMSIHLRSHATGIYTVLIKGAPERVLSICSTILGRDCAQLETLTDAHRAEFFANYELMAAQGHRVLAFARYQLDASNYPDSHVFSREEQNYPQTEGFTFVGLASLEDPPKHGVREAVGYCRRAGIKVVMVTGDHPLTAEAIGRKINLMTNETREQLARNSGVDIGLINESEVSSVVVHGESIDALTDDEWDTIFSKDEIIFARTSPKHKLLIVKKAQSLGHVVGVTGDGVNDSPALKKADLGIAMNVSGSDVSKEAASMILLDDNFASIVNGIREGRLIFSNIKKSIQYILTHILPEVLPQFLFAAFGLPPAIGPLQILVIDMGFELAAALSYAWEGPEDRKLMILGPRRPVTAESIDYLRQRAAFDSKFRRRRSKSNNVEDGTAGTKITTAVDSQSNRTLLDGIEDMGPLTFRERLAQLLSIRYWISFGSPFVNSHRGEILVDGALLLYSYIEAGLIEFAGAFASFYCVVSTQLGTKFTSLRDVQKCLTETNAQTTTAGPVPVPCNGAKRSDILEAISAGQTAFFISILLIQVANLFACKCRISYPFRSYIFQNKFTWISILVGLLIGLAAIGIPGLNTVVNTYPLIYNKAKYVFIPILAGAVLFLWSALRFYIRSWLFPFAFTPEPVGLKMHPTRWSRSG